MKRQKRFMTALVVLALVATVGASAMAKAKAGGDKKVDVIVQFERGASAEERSNASEMGVTKRSYARLKMVALTVPQGRLAALNRQPGVKFVTLDEPVVGFSSAGRVTANTPAIGTTYDNVYNGSGYAIAVIDSGVGSHPDVRVLLQEDFLTGSSHNYAYDAFGHGTHIAGIATGLGSASNFGHWGQAYAANTVSLRVLDGTGQGEESAVIAALDWLLVNGTTYGVRVVNMSLGKAVNVKAADDPLVQAVEAVWDAGFVVVVSAGNYGRYGNGTITSPGNSRKVITVGSITDAGTGDDFIDDYVSSYSSRGPTHFDNTVKPDMLAPGNRVVAAISTEAKMKADLPERLTPCPPSYGSTDLPDLAYCNADYFEMSGTSMAAGMVSGTAIRMITRDPSLTPATVKARLMKSARKIDGNLTEVGAGVLDIYAALDATGTATTALSPAMIKASDGSGMFIEDTGQLWGDPTWDAAFMFSDAFIWSDGFIFSDVFIFSDAFPFSDAFMFSDALMWSDAFIFSDTFIFSDAFIFSDRVNVADSDSMLFLGGQTAALNDDLGTSDVPPAQPDR